MRHKVLIASAVIIGVALAGGLVWILRPSPQKTPAAFVVEEPPSRVARKPSVQETRLQTMAVASCRCERRHPTQAGKDACWKEFKAKIRPQQDGDEGLTLCEPSMHFYDLTTGQTIVTGYRGPGKALFCTADEVQIAATVAAEAARRREKDPRAPSEEAALESLTQQFANGQSTQIAIRERGCAAG